MNDLSAALCRGNWQLFDSIDENDHLVAREICGECPVLAGCAALLNEVQLANRTVNARGAGPVGTWAGKLVGRPGGSYVAIEHGTERGYQQHRYRRSEACPSCLRGHARYEREREVA